MTNSQRRTQHCFKDAGLTQMKVTNMHAEINEFYKFSRSIYWAERTCMGWLFQSRGPATEKKTRVTNWKASSIDNSCVKTSADRRSILRPTEYYITVLCRLSAGAAARERLFSQAWPTRNYCLKIDWLNLAARSVTWKTKNKFSQN